jgi:hypothetical protein
MQIVIVLCRLMIKLAQERTRFEQERRRFASLVLLPLKELQRILQRSEGWVHNWNSSEKQ